MQQSAYKLATLRTADSRAELCHSHNDSKQMSLLMCRIPNALIDCLCFSALTACCMFLSAVRHSQGTY